MGKTAFALDILNNMALKYKHKILIFSYDMSKEHMAKRLLSLEASVPFFKVRTGNIDDEMMNRLSEGAKYLGESNILIDDEPYKSLEELNSKCRKYITENDIDIIFIDHLQLMTGNDEITSRQQEMSYISRLLKSIAREYEIPVVLLSQLPRRSEKRENKRPMLKDMREFGAVEQEADVVLFIYRSHYYHMNSDEGIAEIIIAKNRNGPIGTVKLMWLPEYLRFRDISLEHKVGKGIKKVKKEN
jgi:Replicative DNA helicase